MPANQQFPLSVTIPAATTSDLLAPSTQGMTMNRGAVLTVTILAPATTADVTVKVWVRSTSGGYGGSGGAVVNPDTPVSNVSVEVVPAGAASYRFSLPIAGDFVRVTGEHGGGGSQTLSVAAAILG